MCGTARVAVMDDAVEADIDTMEKSQEFRIEIL
jgi:hypothetical protein